MTGAEHHREAERLLQCANDFQKEVGEQAARSIATSEEWHGPTSAEVSTVVTQFHAAAQVHATLALAAATARLYDVRELLARTDSGSHAVVGFVRDYLADGPQWSADLNEAGKSAGHSTSSIGRARQTLGCVKRKVGKAWRVALPEHAQYLDDDRSRGDTHTGDT